MAARIFDRETLLDLTVNIIPLAIIAFFVVGFAVVNPFGVDPLASSIQFGLLVAPFAALAVLTYLSGKAIAGSEKSAAVYVPGQATVRGEQPIEGHGPEAEPEGELAAGQDEAVAPVEDGAAGAETAGDDAETTTDADADEATEDDADADEATEDDADADAATEDDGATEDEATAGADEPAA